MRAAHSTNVCVVALVLTLWLAGPAAASAVTSLKPAANSSPIAISDDGRFVWSVNPNADTVSVIRTDTNTEVRRIVTGDEPQSVALSNDGRRAFVANAAAGTVAVIRIFDRRPAHFRAGVVRRLTTGAEPWNVVVSPDSRRAFVANSSQDTITVIDTARERIIGDVNMRAGRCGDPARAKHFQPRGLAVTRDSRKLYVTSFLAFTRPGGRQGDDNGRQGLVCRLTIKTSSRRISDYRPVQAIALAPQVTGFTVDSNGDGTPDPTSAFPNQLQSVVIHGNSAYLPNVAASPSGPLRFNVDTQAFVNVIDGVNGVQQTDASAAKFLNLHLGARNPEAGKKKLFFANAWAIAFTSRAGAGSAYVVSAGSDLLVKVNVDPTGKLFFTGDQDTTRYIDLNDPANPLTAGANAGKNPQGIAINKAGKRAYVENFVSHNVSIVDLTTDKVIKTISTAPGPAPGSTQEAVAVGAEVFFSSRGNFQIGATSSSERLSSDGWQSCSSCHFKGLTDGVDWTFNAGPRKSVPLNATFDPRNPSLQRILNYSAIFDEVQDFEANIRNVSGPGPLPAPAPCASDATVPATANDPAHGLLISDKGAIDCAPDVINAFAKPNAGRPQWNVTLPGSTRAIPALDALNEWVRFAVRTPKAPYTTNRLPGRGVSAAQIAQGRGLFQAAGCASCHFGSTFTLSVKDFVSPPAAAELATETTPAPPAGVTPVGAQFLPRFLRDVGSFNLGVLGAGNPLGANIGAPELATAALVNGVSQKPPVALGFDHNGDGKGTGFNVPSLLGINAVPPYMHNGACETLACVVADMKHRTANGTRPDGAANAQAQRLIVAYLQSIDAGTPPLAAMP
jgi:YVTN family beta-propeller protein